MNSRQDQELQQAENLERYLSGLEQGKTGEMAPSSTEEKALFRFAREFKTVAQPIQPSVKLLESIRPVMRKRPWAWLLPLPVVGTLVAATVFFLQYQKPVTDNTVVTSTTVVLSDELAQLDQLDADLAAVTQELDGQISTIDFYSVNEGIEQL